MSCGGSIAEICEGEGASTEPGRGLSAGIVSICAWSFERLVLIDEIDPDAGKARELHTGKLRSAPATIRGRPTRWALAHAAPKSTKQPAQMGGEERDLG